MIERWWVEARRQPGPPPRQPDPAHPGQPQARPAGAPAHHHLLPGYLPGARDGGGQREEPEPRHRRRPHRPRRPTGRGGAPGPGLGPRRLLPPPAGGTAALSCTTSTARSATCWPAPGPLGPGRHRVVFRFDRARGTPADRPPWRSTATVVAEAQLPPFTVAAFSATGAGLTCGYEFGPGRRGGLPGPVSRAPPPSTRPPSPSASRSRSTPWSSSSGSWPSSRRAVVGQPAGLRPPAGGPTHRSLLGLSALVAMASDP